MAKNEKNPPPAAAKPVEPAAANAPAPKKDGKLKLIIIVVLAMVVGGAGAFAAMSMLGGGSPPPAEIEADATPENKDAATAKTPPIEAPKRDNAGDVPATEPQVDEDGVPIVDVDVFMPQNIELKPFIANLGGGRKFLKMTMSVEAETQELATEIEQKMPQFRDTILLLLSSLSADDITTLDGKMRLRNQMLNRINSQLTSGKIKNIYFSEFVMQ